MKKRALSLVLALVLLAALLPLPAEGATSDFTISNGVLTKYNGAGGKVTIPSGVTSIGGHAFKGCTTVTGVSIPSSVTSIGTYAFYGCSKLASISIPSSVTSIGKYAFWCCSSLSSVTLSSRLTRIEEFAFASCTSLSSISIPRGVVSIGSCAFKDCKNLSIVSLPSGLASIEEWAFSGCTSLRSVTIPGSVVTLEGSAFRDCTALTTVTFQEGVTRVAPYIFSGCTSLQSVSIPSTVTVIGSYAFSGCKALTGVTLPYGLTSIDQCGFYYSGLTSLTVPETVTYIGSGAFTGCADLTRIVIPKKTRLYEFSGNDPIFSFAKSVTVYGYTGSPAETHCKKYKIPFVPIDTEINFYLITPASFQEGKDITVRGEVTSKYSVLRFITAEIYRVADSGTDVLQQKTSDDIYDKDSYQIDGSSSWLNYHLHFDQLEPGRYYVRYTASTRDNTTKRGETGVFTVTPDVCKREGHTESEVFHYTSDHPHHRISTCAVCGKEFDAGTLAEWTEWEVVRYATCTQGQLSRRTCTLANQGCTVAEEQESEPLGHDFYNAMVDKPLLMLPADCTNSGGVYKYCFNCCDYVVIDPYPATGHIYGLTHEGEDGAVYSCSQCDDSFTRPHAAAGTAQEGYLAYPTLYQLAWSVSAEGLVEVKFVDPPDGHLGIIIGGIMMDDQRAMVACYGEDGTFLDVKILDPDHTTAQIDPTAPLVKIFWMDKTIPLSPCDTIWTP